MSLQTPEYASPDIARPKTVLLYIALACAVLPLIVGCLITALYLLTRAHILPLAGFLTILGGLAAFVTGYPTGHQAVEEERYVGHIRRIGEKKLDEKKRKRRKARRWVVERTHGWLSKCRAILVRYAKKSSNYLGIIQLACALLWYRRQYRMTF